MQRACELLATTVDPLDQIAAACGFEGLPNFYTVFKRRTGRTPAAYRRWVRGRGQ